MCSSAALVEANMPQPAVDRLLSAAGYTRTRTRRRRSCPTTCEPVEQPVTARHCSESGAAPEDRGFGAGAKW